MSRTTEQDYSIDNKIQQNFFSTVWRHIWSLFFVLFVWRSLSFYRLTIGNANTTFTRELLLWEIQYILTGKTPVFYHPGQQSWSWKLNEDWSSMNGESEIISWHVTGTSVTIPPKTGIQQRRWVLYITMMSSTSFMSRWFIGESVFYSSLCEFHQPISYSTGGIKGFSETRLFWLDKWKFIRIFSVLLKAFSLHIVVMFYSV